MFVIDPGAIQIPFWRRAAAATFATGILASLIHFVLSSSRATTDRAEALFDSLQTVGFTFFCLGCLLVFMSTSFFWQSMRRFSPSVDFRHDGFWFIHRERRVFFCEWSNVRGLGRTQWRPNPGYGLVLHRPISFVDERGKSRHVKGLAFVAYANDWQDSELSATIAHFAPHAARPIDS